MAMMIVTYFGLVHCAISSSENLCHNKMGAFLFYIHEFIHIRVRLHGQKRFLMSQFHEWCLIWNCDCWFVSSWITCDLSCNLHPGLPVMEELCVIMMVLWYFSHCRTKANISGAETSFLCRSKLEDMFLSFSYKKEIKDSNQHSADV